MDTSTAESLAHRAAIRWLETSRAYPTRSLELALLKAASEYGHLSDLSLLAASLDMVPHVACQLQIFQPDLLYHFLWSPSQERIRIKQATSLSLRELLQRWDAPYEAGDEQLPTYIPGEDYRVDPILEWKNSKPAWFPREKLEEFFIVDLSRWLRLVASWVERFFTLRSHHPLLAYMRYIDQRHYVKGSLRSICVKELRRIASALSDLEALTGSHESLIMLASGSRLAVRPLSHLAHGFLTQDSDYPEDPAIAASINSEISPFGFGADAIMELESLINSSLSKELDLQRFFERYPHFLLGLDYSRLIAQPILRRESEPNLIPDFVLLPLETGGRSPKIVDLKLPGHTLVRRDTNRLGYLSAVHRARDQLLEYQRYFSRTTTAQEASLRWGQEVFMPEICVVIGRSSSFASALERQRARASAPDLEVITYDDVLSSARRLLDIPRT